jgi:cytidine deaminase
MRAPTDAERELHRAAAAALDRAHAPYSGFRVAAAVRARDGSVTIGVNVENASYGLTICAERSAVFAAVAAGHRELDAIAVHAAAATAAPCGACRQVLREFGGGIVVVFPLDGDLVAATVDELLPVAFEL